jgi:hypothetical protein
MSNEHPIFVAYPLCPPHLRREVEDVAQSRTTITLGIKTPEGLRLSPDLAPGFSSRSYLPRVILKSSNSRILSSESLFKLDVHRDIPTKLYTEFKGRIFEFHKSPIRLISATERS